MSGASKQRTRQERIDSLGIQKPRLVQWWQDSDKADFTIRVGVAVVAALALLVFCQTWQPPFAYRRDAIPARDLVTRVTFDVPNEAETKAAQDRARRAQVAFYRNQPQPLNLLRGALRDQLYLVLTPPSFDSLKEEERIAFAQFFEGSETEPDDTPALRFSMLKTVLAGELEPTMKKLDEVLDLAMEDNYKFGLIQALSHGPDEGSQDFIRVYPAAQPDVPELVQVVAISDARIAQAGDRLIKNLKELFRTKFQSPGDDSQKVAEMISEWIVSRLPKYETLQYDKERSEAARQKAAESVLPVMTPYETGSDRLAEAGKPLSDEELVLLRREWQELVGKMHVADKIARMAAYAGMIAALYLLCGSYIFFVDDRRLLLDRWKLAKLLTVMVVTDHARLLCLTRSMAWRIDSAGVGLDHCRLSCTVANLDLLLMAAASVSLTLFLGADLPEVVMMAAACTSCMLLLAESAAARICFTSVRSRRSITIMTVVGVGIVTGQTLSAGEPGSELEPIVPRPPVRHGRLGHCLRKHFGPAFAFWFRPPR